MTTQTFVRQAPDFIKLLANDLRWSVLKALTIGDFQVNELVTLVQQPMNLVSYHLKQMRDDGLVTTRRSEADGRDVYYSLEWEHLRQMYRDAGIALHPAVGFGSLPSPAVQLKRQGILFVCTHNSARSQMAEGILRSLTHGQLDVFSAGSEPTAVHPNAIATMRKFGTDITSQRSRSLSEFEGQTFDFVITVCDKAREVCPTFPGTGVQMHWGFADPVGIQDDQARAEFFDYIAQRLKSRLEYFVSTLPTTSSESDA
jgi:protein-tyrosine-phosphatase/DNA-binding transcriptional ArsR family regulator